MENRNGLAFNGWLTQATRRTEPQAAPAKKRKK